MPTVRQILDADANNGRGSRSSSGAITDNTSLRGRGTKRGRIPVTTIGNTNIFDPPVTPSVVGEIQRLGAIDRFFSVQTSDFSNPGSLAVADTNLVTSTPPQVNSVIAVPNFQPPIGSLAPDEGEAVQLAGFGNNPIITSIIAGIILAAFLGKL